MRKKNLKKISNIEFITLSILFFIASFSIYVVPKISLCALFTKHYESNTRETNLITCTTEFNIADIVSIIVVAIFIFLFIKKYKETKEKRKKQYERESNFERLKEKFSEIFPEYFLVSFLVFLIALFVDTVFYLSLAVGILIIHLIKLPCNFIIFKFIIVSVIVYFLYLFLVEKSKNKIKLILFMLLSLFLVLLFLFGCFVAS